MQDQDAGLADGCAVWLEVPGLDLVRGGDVAQVDQPGAAHRSIGNHLVDRLAVGEEVKRRIHVRSGVQAEGDAAQVDGGIVENGDVHGAISGKNRRIRVQRLAQIDDALAAHATPILALITSLGPAYAFLRSVLRVPYRAPDMIGP